jgi:hypothetical protein
LWVLVTGQSSFNCEISTANFWSSLLPTCLIASCNHVASYNDNDGLDIISSYYSDIIVLHQNIICSFFVAGTSLISILSTQQASYQ